jgi:hypothetical protein
MPAPYTARCLCGSVSATIKAEPLGIRQCWCRQCQQAAGGSATTNAVFMVADVDLVGELGTHSYAAASGNTLTQHFCPACGTPVYGQSSARMHMLSLRLGFLDEGHSLRPDAAIWLQDAPDWAVIDPALEHHERQPPPPAPPPAPSPPS